MKLTQLNSATVLIENSNENTKTKILCDPWLAGEEYIGSWAIYPPYDFKPEQFKDVDFIYISHIHPDHSSSKTLSQLDKKIPVLIHNFPEKFLKNKIEGLGFKVIELEHGIRTRLKDNLFINILAADNCNPEICGQLMGCGLLETKYQTTQIDTMAVFDNQSQVIVNTNDCPYDIGKLTAKWIKNMYKKIDLLLVGYVAASSWPHCYELSPEEKEYEAKIKSIKKLNTTKKYIELFEPKYFLPFAGKYTLCGKNVPLNKYRGEPEIEDAFEWLIENVPQEKFQCIQLNNDSTLDIDTGIVDNMYIPINKKEKEEYIKNHLTDKKFPYELINKPERKTILDLIPIAYANFEKIRKKINWDSNAFLVIQTFDSDNQELSIMISCNGNGFKIISEQELDKYEHYMKISLDIRLLYWLLQGPQKAYWSNADLGSHLKYKRVGSTYKRGLFYCLNHFFLPN